MTDNHKLRHGFTTGACAAAAAKGAALMLARQSLIDTVDLQLPTGVSAPFTLHGQAYALDSATCFVIKDAGDDPDVTNGVEVHARVMLQPSPLSPLEGNISIIGGTGIGRVTKPGLAVAPGEWAINPVPRRMITEAVAGVLPERRLVIEISIPDGEARATKTLNARLGILGGLSILGTTGVVRPISAKAWTDTIDAALDVAKACGCPTVLLSTGRTSEMAAQTLMSDLREEACIMMGDHVAYSLQACEKRGFLRPLIACQFAKLLKIACGHVNTHAAVSELDLAELKHWTQQAGLPEALQKLISEANTAREIAVATTFDRHLLDLVCTHAGQAVGQHAAMLVPNFLIADYEGSIVFSA